MHALEKSMQDPIGSHPTRDEQLDVLISILADTVPEGGSVLDLGCGTGYVDWLLLKRRGDVHLTGLDLKIDSLTVASEALGEWEANVVLEQSDLSSPAALESVEKGYDAAFTALVFHDLDDEAKQACIQGSADRLKPGGLFLVYDRVRLDAPACFPLQRAVWNRIERVHGRGMRSADDFAAYEADLASNNRPARLVDYQAWMKEAGFKTQLLHLHGNVMLIGGIKTA